MSLSFITVVGGLVYVNRVHPAVFGLYTVMSVYAFLLYAKDKAAAQNGRFRISETHLHLVSLFGGWPGAMPARAFLRHKSSKRSFSFVFRLTILINAGTFLWTLSPQGVRIIKAWINVLSAQAGPFS
ncbi:hypothetical protein JCM14469_37480 [Desulfatiferula olefinivorans]